MNPVRFALLTVCGVSALALPVAARGQALTTASKGAEISVFGGYLASSPDYGGFAKKGVAAGGDFTVFLHLPVTPSLEIRGDIASGPAVTERTVLVGLKVEREYRTHLHPYADILVGEAQIVYHPDPYANYNADRSLNISYGGGLDIDAVRHFSVKFDFQEQNWNLGKNGVLQPSGANYTLTPRTYMVGVVYHIPFRTLNSQKDFNK